ncbi:PspC domain-containing protein [Actinoplanes sp. NPDC051346]|uniref:PspC domain-containing protein n=1 Tax=Actinoplanes sp. NPDC051346 TaxID=3155048 RepID=UPI003449B230
MTDSTVAPYKQLRRPTDDRIVAGVCSGLGRYLSVDPVLIRVGFAALAVVTWGTALLAYPIAWFLMPEEPAPAAPDWLDPAHPSWGQTPTYPAAPPTGVAPTSTPPAA